jgi:hypothetical protein
VASQNQRSTSYIIYNSLFLVKGLPRFTGRTPIALKMISRFTKKELVVGRTKYSDGIV